MLTGASWLAGIGFTISLFIASAAFPDPTQVANAKLAILVASVLAAVAGSALLLVSGRVTDYRATTRLAAAAAD